MDEPKMMPAGEALGYAVQQLVPKLLEKGADPVELGMALVASGVGLLGIGEAAEEELRVGIFSALQAVGYLPNEGN